MIKRNDEEKARLFEYDLSIIPGDFTFLEISKEETFSDY